MTRYILVVICLWASLGLSLVSAQDVFTLQGVLVGKDGSSLPDGEYQVGVTFYPSLTSTTSLCDFAPITVRQQFGAFSIELEILPQCVDSLRNHPSGFFVGFRIIGEDELRPRMKVGSVPSALTARFAESSAGSVPVGTVVSYIGSIDSMPRNWLPCDGRAMNSASYPDLFKVIGRQFGDGSRLARDTSEYDFNLPDFRGRFLIGTGDNYYTTPMDSRSSSGDDRANFSPNNLGAGPQFQAPPIVGSFVHIIVRVR